MEWFIVRMKTQSIALVLGLMAASAAHAREPVNVSDLPAPVQRAIDGTGNRASLKEVTKDTVDGQVVYDVEFEKNNALNPRLRILPDGTVLQGEAANGVTARLSDAAAAAGETLGRAADKTGDALARAVDSSSDAFERATDSGERTMDRATERTNTAINDEGQLAVALASLPTAVRNAIDQHAKGRRVVDVEQEVSNGQTVYEVEFSDPGINPQIHVSADGTLVKSDQEGLRGMFAGTRIEDTPQAVQSTVQRELGGAEIVDVDKEVRTGRTVYEVEFRGANGSQQIHVAEDGTVVKDDRVQ